MKTETQSLPSELNFIPFHFPSDGHEILLSSAILGLPHELSQ